MSNTKSVYESLMKIVVRIADVVQLAKRFEESPTLAMREVVTEMRAGVRDVLERVMAAELELFLGRGEEAGNKRNGFVSRAFGIKGLGTVKLRMPRDRGGRSGPRAYALVVLFVDYLDALMRLYARAGRPLPPSPPALVTSLRALQKSLPAALPAGLCAAWLQANGGRTDEPVFARPGFLTGYDFLSVSGARHEIESLRKRAPRYRSYVEPSPRDNRILPGWFAPGWVPFAGFGGGSLLLLADLSPSPAGAAGQVIAFTHDPDEISFVASSFEHFLVESLRYLEEEAIMILSP